MSTRDERSLGQLVASATESLSDLIRGEIALAKSELRFSLNKAGQGIGLFAAAAFVVVLAVIILCITAALGLEALGLPAWLSFLIVAVFLLLVAAVLGFIGYREVKQVKAPERTIATVQEAKEVLTHRGTPDAGPPSLPSAAAAASDLKPARTN